MFNLAQYSLSIGTKVNQVTSVYGKTNTAHNKLSAMRTLRPFEVWSLHAKCLRVLDGSRFQAVRSEKA